MMAHLSKMIQFTAAAMVASQPVDGFVLPVGRVSLSCKQRMRRNNNPLAKTLAAQSQIEGILNDADSDADAAIIIQEETADEEEQTLQDQFDDEDDIIFDEEDLADAEDVLLQSTDQQRKNNSPRMRMYSYLSQPVIEVRIIGLVLMSCLLQAINTVENIPAEVHQGINVVDTFFVYIFAIEFFLRWWSAGRFQFRYLTKPLVSIDAVVVILPLILSGILPVWDFGVMAGFIPGVSLPGWLLSTSSANSALLNLRLLRILKFQRVLTNQNTYMNFEMALGMKQTDVRPYQLQLARVVISIFTLVSVSTGLIYTAEHEANPLFTDYFTALYFGLVSRTHLLIACRYIDFIQHHTHTFIYLFSTQG